jgi:nucleoside-diphosphate-sugar epimerase
MKKTKILITGAGGFLGSHIVKKLILNESYEVYGFSRSFYPWLEALGVRQRLGDLRKSEDVEKALSGMDAVIHTASLVGMWGKYEDFYATNVIGTENILHALKKHNIKKLIYTSTPSVVFGNVSLCGVDETTPFPSKYLSHYASTKALAEKSVLQANGPELYTVALRPHLIFGPGDTNLIPRVIQAQKENV